MVPRSRRRVLQWSAAAVAVASAGCLGGSSPAQDAAQRRIDHGTTPAADAWPTEDDPFREPEPAVVETLEPRWYPEIVSATLADGAFYLGQFGDSVADLRATARQFHLTTDDERWVTPFDRSGVGDRIYVGDADGVHAFA